MMGTRRALSGKSCGLIEGRSGFCSSKGTPERSQAAATRSGYKRVIPPPSVRPRCVPTRPRELWTVPGVRSFVPGLSSLAGKLCPSRFSDRTTFGSRLCPVVRRGGKQSAIVPAGQRLPVEIPSPGKSGFAGTLSASVLVNDHAAQGLDSCGTQTVYLTGKSILPVCPRLRSVSGNRADRRPERRRKADFGPKGCKR